MTLQTKIGSLSMPTPLLTASGTFGHDATALDFLDPKDVGALVLKTVTPEPRAGNPPPRMAEYSAGILNSIGLENRGLEFWRKSVASELERVPVKVIANAGGHDLGEFVSMVEAFDSMNGVSGIELNLSCPNVDGGTRFATDKVSLGEVVRACREVTTKPLWVKLAPIGLAIEDFAGEAEAAGADALTVSNTYLGLLVDWKTRKPCLGRGYGGVSGPGIKPLTMKLVYECYKSVNLPVIASGGASSAQDVLEFLVAGATAVQIGTAGFRSPNILSAIAGQLRSILSEEKIGVSDLIGSLDWPDVLN